jgi:hypothetical protein
MNCLICRSAIPLVHRFVKADLYFCSDAHRSEYQVENQRLMIASLLETRNKYSKFQRRRRFGVATSAEGSAEFSSALVVHS